MSSIQSFSAALEPEDNSREVVAVVDEAVADVVEAAGKRSLEKLQRQLMSWIMKWYNEFIFTWKKKRLFFIYFTLSLFIFKGRIHERRGHGRVDDV